MFADRYFGKRYFGNRYFGPNGAEAVVTQQPGGGFYRPIKYIRDGKVYDTPDEPVEVVELDELPANIPLSPALIRALRVSQIPVPDFRPDVASVKADVRRLELQMQAEDDEAVALLLLS